MPTDFSAWLREAQVQGKDLRIEAGVPQRSAFVARARTPELLGTERLRSLFSSTVKEQIIIIHS